MQPATQTSASTASIKGYAKNRQAMRTLSTQFRVLAVLVFFVEFTGGVLLLSRSGGLGLTLIVSAFVTALGMEAVRLFGALLADLHEMAEARGG